MSELARVLKPDGVLMVVGPDVDRADDPVLIRCIVDGGHRWPGDEHQWTSTCTETARWLTGRFRVREIPVGEVDGSWPLAGRDDWQFALQATKETDG